TPDYRTYPCPFPPRAWIDPPVAGATLSGIFHIEGWAYNEDIGVDSVELLIDGEPVATMNYGAVRDDVVAVMDVRSDPNAPRLGYSYEFDTLRFANGEYVLAIRITNLQGTSTIYGEREITIAN
ncbi:MAG: Ig-like domain-containing protein, partial [Gammaproteobacteria bacterium]